MRVDSTQNWAFASRDLFKAKGCEHCLRLLMAVKAGVPSVVERVAPYEEDLNSKLPIIQGNQREQNVFAQLRASLPDGDFVEFERATAQETLDAMRRLVPVIAQGYFARTINGYFWSGYADLLVLEGYEVYQTADGLIAARKAGEVPAVPRYKAWDVKNSSSGDVKYQIQLASYLDALQELGMDSEDPIGIVLGFGKGVVEYDPAASLGVYREALAELTRILDLTTPATITADFVETWACAKKSVCEDYYCDYPRLCKATRKENQVLEILPSLHFTHSPKFRGSGITNVGQLAEFEAAPEVTGLDQKHVDRYWRAAKLIQLERAGHTVILSKVAGVPALPEPTAEDLFFDVEWASPVDAEGEFVFMFGVVTADEGFEVFIAKDPSEELQAFDRFLDFGLALLERNPDMHIYHYHNPEPQKVRMLVKRYKGHRTDDAERLVAQMVDLKPVVTDALLPGSGSYSIKALEKYYQADAKLNRGGLVADGGDAMLQYERFRVAEFETGDSAVAAAIMQGIAAYNKDDCLSTKLLYDWLRSLNFAAADELWYLTDGHPPLIGSL